MPPEDTTPKNLCACGCGRTTNLAFQTNRKLGWVKGQPLRFCHGHGGRKFHADSYVVDENGCWIWTGTIDPGTGYGRYFVDGRCHSAPRYFYERAHGPLPAGYVPDHCCPGGPNRACVNPAHLRPRTLAENSRWKKSTRLDWETVHAIRALSRTMTPAAISRRFGLSASYTARIIRQEIWRE